MKIIEKEEQVIESGTSFKYSGGGDSAVLLIHGFTGNPYSMRILGTYLADKGIDAFGVRLAGHGTAVEKLAQTDYRDWQESVRVAFNQIRIRYKHISIVGLSFGGNLAFNLTRCYPNIISRIVTIGTPVLLNKPRLNRYVVPYIKRFKKYYKKEWAKEMKSDSVFMKRSYDRIPLDSYNSFIYFINNFTKKELPHVKVPTLVIHSQDDVVIPPKSAEIIYNTLGSKEKELFWLKNSYHDPLVDEVTESLLDKIYQFLMTTSPH
ncbi:alpha/beta fold hydrolase [Patescibacteria group bacterium]|nr:alpha/beta fold hydrolase [Patescibacteria group bacterium]